MRNILYCANNDGSDTRIYKEIKNPYPRGLILYLLV